MEAPRYEHDCDICVFSHRIGEYDLYLHPWENGYKNYVARRSSEGSDYESGDISIIGMIEKRCLDR